jgi:hypothetical protein
MSHGDTWVGKRREKCRIRWVASTLHATSEHAVSSITTADVHTSAASSQMNWRPKRTDWNGPLPLATKKKSVFCACAIIFQSQSAACSRLGGEARQSAHMHCCLQTVSWMCVGNFRHRSWVHNFLFSPGLFTRWQTRRHILRASQQIWNFSTAKLSHLLSHKMSNYPSLSAWRKGKVESRGIALLILRFGTWWRWVVSFTPQPL